MDLNEARKRIPQLAGFDDQTAFELIRTNYYPDVDVNVLAQRLNYTPKPIDAPEQKAGVLRTVGDIGLKLGQGVVDAGSMVVGAANLASGGLVGKGLRSIGYDPKAANEIIGGYLSDEQKQAEANVAQADGFTDSVVKHIENPRAIFGGIAQSAPAMLNSMAVSRAIAQRIGLKAALSTAEGAAIHAAELQAGKSAAQAAAAAIGTESGRGAAKAAIEAAGTRLIGAGAATEGIQTAGKIADDAQAAGREYSDYALPALGAGAVTAAVGLGSGRLFGDASTQIATGANAGMKGGIVARGAKGFLTEGLVEEAPQSYSEQVFTNIANGEQDITKGASTAAGAGFIIGGAQGGGMAMVQGRQKLPETGVLTRSLNAGIDVENATQQASVPTSDAQQPTNLPITQNSPARPFTGMDSIISAVENDNNPSLVREIAQRQAQQQIAQPESFEGVPANFNELLQQSNQQREQDRIETRGSWEDAKEQAARELAEQDRIEQESRLRLPAPDMPMPEGALIDDNGTLRPQTYQDAAASQVAAAQREELGQSVPYGARGGIENVNVPSTSPEAPSVILHPSGKPFTTKIGAQSRLKQLGGNHVVVPVEGGFAIHNKDVESNTAIEPKGVTSSDLPQAVQPQVNEIQPGDIMLPSGKPFTVKYPAIMTQRQSGGDIVEVKGGFIVRPPKQPSLEEIVAESQSVPEYEKGKTGAETARNKLNAENPFLSFLGKHGLNIDERSDVGGERGKARLIPGHGPLFRKNGLRLDELAKMAQEAGFLSQQQIDSDTDNGGVNALSDMIGLALNNEVVPKVQTEPEVNPDLEMLNEATRVGLDVTGKTPDQVYDMIKEYHSQAQSAVMPKPQLVSVDSATLGPANKDYESKIVAPAREAVKSNNATKVDLKDGSSVHLVNMEDGDGVRTIVAVSDAGDVVGSLGYSTVPGFNPDVYVEDSFQRQGVATAMYDLAESTGGVIPPIDAGNAVRTESGAAFRNARAGMPTAMAQNDEPSTPKRSPEEINIELQKLTDAVRERTKNFDLSFDDGNDINFMTPEEKSYRHELLSQLPSSGEEQLQAKKRIEEKIAARREAKATDGGQSDSEQEWNTAVDLFNDLSLEAQELAREYNLHELYFDIEELENAETNDTGSQGQASEPVTGGTIQTEEVNRSDNETTSKQAERVDAVEAGSQESLDPELVQKESAKQASEDEDGVIVRAGKGLISGKFLSEIDGDGVPGGPFETEDQARTAAIEWKNTKIRAGENDKAERERRGKLADKVKAGSQLSSDELKSIGLREDYSDMRWFIGAAADLFGISSRSIRSNVSSLIKDAYTDMGAKRELVPTNKALQAISNSLTKSVAPITDLGEKIGGARKDTASATGQRASQKPKVADQDEPAWRRRYVAVEKVVGSNTTSFASSGKWAIQDTKTGKMAYGTNFANQEEAEKAIPLYAVSQKHRVQIESRGDEPMQFGIWRQVSDSKRVKVVKENFGSREEAMQYLADHAAQIIETKTSYREELFARPEKVMRQGKERRTGDVDGNDFIKTFGFRGVEFGNWNNQAERQELLNHAYDGLMDLAEILNIPNKAISLNGDLGLAFGARGQGLTGAAAHYERGYGVINLTKMAGAGSLAHEWFHAFDHYVGRLDGKASSEKIADKNGNPMFDAKDRSDDYASHGFRYESHSKARKELRDLYEDLIKKMFSKAEMYVEDTANAEKFVKKTRDSLADQLKKLRDNLSSQLDERYYKRKNKPASQEQLMRFDAIAESLINGENLETSYVVKESKNRNAITTGHRTNSSLQEISDIYKDVRGRSGHLATGDGVSDVLQGHMARYLNRIKILKEAESGSEKTKRAPTSYRMDATEIDQGSATDYWSTPHEMAARAFSAYVEDKVLEQGGKSDFLSYGSSNGFYAMYGVRPFPAGAERTEINASFDKLFAELKTKETDKGIALFSREGGQRSKFGFDVDELQPIVDQISSTWKNKPKINIVQTIDDLPFDAPSDARGAYFKKQVYLVAANLRDQAQAEAVLLHETLGHAGLNELFGEKLAPALRSIAMKNRKIAEAAAVWRKGNTDIKGKMSDDRYHLVSIEEALADYVGTGRTINGVEKLLAAIQKGLRAIGLNSVANWMENATDAEVLSMLASAKKHIEKGSEFSVFGEQQAQAFSRDEKALLSTDTEKSSFLNGAPIAKLNSADAPMGGYKEVQKWAADIFASQGGIAHRSEVGEITLDERAAKSSMAHGGANKYKKIAFVAVKDVIEKGVLVLKSEYRGEESFYFSAPIMIDGNINIETVLVRRDANTKRMYLHSVTTIGSLLNQRVSSADQENLVERSGSTNAGDITTVLQKLINFNIDQANEDEKGLDAKLSRSITTGDNNRTRTQEQLRAFENVGRTVQVPTLKERFNKLTENLGKRLAQGIVDQFAPIKDLSAEAYGLMRLSKGASGAFEAMLKGGQLKLSDGVYDFDDTKRGGVVDRLLVPLQGEADDFMWWVAGNRAESLTAQGKEHLFTADDIKAFKSLSDGQSSFDYTIQHGLQKGKTTRDRAIIYADSLKTFNEFNKNTLDMAEQSGLIDPESRKIWESEFYIPFYRVSEESDDGVRGMNIKSGVVRQQAFKKLKGGTDKLNSDLLENTLMNWAHLLDASAKNRAAKSTLEAAENIGAAMPAMSGDKKTVWYMDGGEKKYFAVEDAHLLAAIQGLEYAGMRSPIMNAMSTMKHAMTVGVTASPFFKIRNLIRDSVSAIGIAGLDYNPAKNIKEGWKLTDPKSDDYFRLLAGGGTIHFGSMLEGSEAKRIRKLVESGVDESTILNSDSAMKSFYRKHVAPAVDAYNELGNRGESINRASLYDQLIKQGKSHAEASLLARDLMDFSMQGAWTSIRFLTQVVPFMNARLQGLYKLGRSAKEDPKRFGTVLGAVSVASIALMLAYSDDDDWKKREDWDRDNFWWFKIGGTAFRIPKPFEIGAIGTLAERGIEYFTQDEMTGDRFIGRFKHLMLDSLSMNPIPQMIKPVIDVYANKDSFTGRPIETMSMERLRADYRFNGSTSMAARGLSTAGNSVTGDNFLSPVQIDHLIRGYFGWLGAFAVGSADRIVRPFSGEPEKATPDYAKWLSGGMVADTKTASSRYVSQMYEQAKALDEAYGTWRMLIKTGKVEEAKEFAEENADKLHRYKGLQNVKKQATSLNEQVRVIERSNLDPDEKREKINLIQQRKDNIARRASL